MIKIILNIGLLVVLMVTLNPVNVNAALNGNVSMECNLHHGNDYKDLASVEDTVNYITGSEADLEESSEADSVEGE